MRQVTDECEIIQNMDHKNEMVPFISNSMNDIRDEQHLIKIFLDQKTETARKTYGHTIGEYFCFLETFCSVFELRQAGISALNDYKTALTNTLKNNGEPLPSPPSLNVFIILVLYIILLMRLAIFHLTQPK